MAVLAQPSSVESVLSALSTNGGAGPAPFVVNVTVADAATSTTIDGASQGTNKITVASTANMAVGSWLGLPVTGGTVNRQVASITSATVVVVTSGPPPSLTWTNGGTVTIEPLDANGPFAKMWADSAGAIKFVDLYGNIQTITVQAGPVPFAMCRVYSTGTTVSSPNSAIHGCR